MIDSNLPEYNSLSETIRRVTNLSSDVLDDAEMHTPTTSLSKLIEGLRDLIQALEVLTPSIEQHKKIQHMAFYDGLTELPNRQFFDMYIQQAISLVGCDSPFYLVFIDLDGFKKINDVYGHDAGDMLLKHVAQRLRQNLKQEDFVARLGGDEFVVVIKDSDSQNLDFILNRIISVISMPYSFDSLNLEVNASLGVAKYSSKDESPTDLIRKADQAMYTSKSKGSNLYTLSF